MTSGRPDYVIEVGGRTPEKVFIQSQVQVPVAMFDDFESGVIKFYGNEATLTLDSTAAGYPSPSPVYSGAYCLKIAVNADTLAYIERQFSLPELAGRYGFSYNLTFLDGFNPADTNDSLVFFHLQLWVNGNYIVFGVCQNQDTMKLYWFDDVDINNLHEIPASYYDRNVANYVKLVIDITKGYAVYFIFNGIKYDLSADALGITADVNYNGLGKCRIYTRTSTWASAFYIDDFKITYNEP